MYNPELRQRKRLFDAVQRQIVSQLNAHGRGAVLRAPSDAALEGATYSVRGMMALARAYTRPID